MSKTKLLVIGDAGRPTGFEKVVRNVVEQLDATDRYDITIRGLGYAPALTQRVYPVPVKPATSHPGDPIGISAIGDWIAEDTPDLIFSVMDLWGIAGYATFKGHEIPMAAYIPIDTPNTMWNNALALPAVAAVAAYTDFGARELALATREAADVFLERLDDAQRSTVLTHFQVPKFGEELTGRLDRFARYQEPKNISVIPHGFEHGVFEPRDQAEARKRFGIPADAFVVTNIGTNQFRKRLDLTLRAFALLRRDVPKAVLVLHCAGFKSSAMDGYNLRQFARRLGVHEHIRLIHEELQGDLTDDALCWLYNVADVNINTSGGEGWGLCSVESAACGVPQIVPDWSGTREIWEDHALLSRIADYRIEPKVVLNTAHAVVDIRDVAFDLRDLAQSAEMRDEYGRLAKARADAMPSWMQVGQQFDALLQAALAEQPASPMSFAEIPLARRTPLESELVDWDR